MGLGPTDAGPHAKPIRFVGFHEGMLPVDEAKGISSSRRSLLIAKVTLRKWGLQVAETDLVHV